MNILNFIPVVNFTNGVVVTIISIILGLGIIIALILFVKNSKKRKNMVHNRKKNNDNPEKLR